VGAYDADCAKEHAARRNFKKTRTFLTRLTIGNFFGFVLKSDFANLS
jgi:hypothetical protein